MLSIERYDIQWIWCEILQASSNTSTSKILHSIALNLATIITKIISMILKWMFFKLSLLPVHSFIFSKCVNTYRHLNTNFWKYLNYVHGCMSHHKKIKIRYNSFNRKWLGYYMNIISIPTSATGATDGTTRNPISPQLHSDVLL